MYLESMLGKMAKDPGGQLITDPLRTLGNTCWVLWLVADVPGVYAGQDGEIFKSKKEVNFDN